MIGSEYWHQIDREEPAHLSRSIFATRDAIIDEQSNQRSAWAKYATYYFDREISEPIDKMPLDLSLNAEPLIIDKTSMAFVSWNLCRSIPDALVAVLTMHDPAVRVQTMNAPELVQYKARDMETFIEANKRVTRLSKRNKLALRVTYIFGCSFVKIFPVRDKLKVRVRRPDELIVDHRAEHGEVPPMSFDTDYVERAALAALYPDSATLIESAPRAPVDSEDGTRFRDRVEVCEPFWIPGAGEKGRRVVAIKNGILADEEWTRPHARFAVLHATEPTEGYHGDSLLAPIIGIQQEINYSLEDLRGNHRHLGHAFIKGRRPTREQDDPSFDRDLLNTHLYKYVDASAGDFEIVHPPLAHPQQYRYPMDQWAKGFEVLGLNQLMAHAAKPPGLTSGAALREHKDSQTQRFSEHEANYDQLSVDEAELILDAGKDIDAQGGWSVRSTGDNFAKEMNWAEIGLPGDQYVISRSPGSSLPHDPSGRRAELGESIRQGVIDREQAQQLLGWNDLAKHRNIQNALIENLEFTFEHMLTTGEYLPPEQWQDLRRGLDMGRKYCARESDNINREKDPSVKKEAQKNLKVLKKWLKQVTKMIGKPKPPPQAMVPEGMPAGPEAAQQLGAAAARLQQV